MKTILHKIAIVLFFLTALIACQKDESLLKADDPIAETPQPPPTQSTITGTIDFPPDSVIDLNNLSITSPIGKATVSNGSYEMATHDDKFITQLVSDSNGTVLLMGYTYPGQTNFDINIRSTALAMLMNLPFSLFLPEEAKSELIAIFLADPNFKNLEETIEAGFKENINLLDISHPELATAVSLFYSEALFPQASKTNTSDYSYDPVDIRITNNELTFVNLGKTYSTEIGIYKDNAKIKNITSERITFLPTTIGAAIGAFASAYGGTPLPGDLQAAEYNYTFDEDGQYEVKIRTGNLPDTGIENQVAGFNNYVNWGVDIIVEVLPLGDCVQPIIADFKQHAQTFGSFSDATSEQEKIGLLYDVLYTFFKQTETLINCLGSGEQLEDYIKKFASVFKFLDLVGKIGNGGNILVGIAQWFTDNGKMDKCYTVEGLQVNECQEGDVYVAGYVINDSNTTATVWKNGVASPLTSGTNNSVATSVYVSGSVVYVAGRENVAGTNNWIAKVWKNGVASSLTDGTSLAQASSIFVSNDDVYVAGYHHISNRRLATIWKNGIATYLTEQSDISKSEANSVFVKGTDVYVAGYERISATSKFVAKVWKNGVATSLTDEKIAADALSVHVSGSDVYVAGYERTSSNPIAKVWKNGVPIALNNDGISSYANSVYASGSDVYGHENEYIMGTNNNVAKVWKNGVASPLTIPGIKSFANSIFVK